MDGPGLPTLYEAIGRRVQELRVADGLTRSELAARANELGLPWSERVVSQTERGGRKVTLDEFLRLPLLFGVGLEAFLAGDGWVELDAHATAQLEGLRMLVCGGLDQFKPLGHMSTPLSRRLLAEAETAQQPTVPGGIWEQPGSVRPDAPDRAAGREAERKAAASLGIPTATLVDQAYRLWGRSLVEERDHRVKSRNVEPSGERTVRGHVTRELMRELNIAAEVVHT